MSRKIVKLETKYAPNVVGPYSQGVDTGDFVFLSGQIGINPTTQTLEEGVEAQTHQALKNLGAVLKKANLTFSDVVRCEIMLKDISHFQIINTIYAEYFTSKVQPARQAYGVSDLPKGALVEISVIAKR